MFMMIIPFLNQDPIFECPDTSSPTGYSKCSSLKEGCEIGRLIAKELQPSSLVIDFELYCDNSSYKTLGNTFFAVGGSIGNVLGPVLANIIGRRPTLYAHWILGTICIFVLGLFTYNVYLYFFVILLIWGGYDPYATISNIAINEQAGRKSYK